MDDHEEPGAVTSAAPGADWLSAWFDRMMPDVDAWAEQFRAIPVTGQAVVVPAGEPFNGFLVPPIVTETMLEAVKLSGVIHVPFELVNPPDSVPPTWRTRFRWKRAEWREQAARRAYRLIAGDWPDDEEDY